MSRQAAGVPVQRTRARWGTAPWLRTVAGAGGAALLGLVAVLPLLAARPTRSVDGLLHLYRQVEFQHCLAQGALFPRWTPDLMQGYGFPLFNFYPPLAYYVTALWHLLGLSTARALNVTFLAGALLAGAAMFLLARDWAGEGGGVLAGLLYMYAPYTFYNTLYRGGLAEVLAWALAPLILWAFRRLMLEGRARWFALAALSLAALPLAHHLSLLTFAPLLALLVLGTWLEQWFGPAARGARRGLLLALLALALGLGISAFFAAPAYLEKGLVQIQHVYQPQGFDFHDNFATLPMLLGRPLQVDTSIVSYQFPRNIGWIQLALGLLAPLGMLFARRNGRAVRAWYLGALLVALGLVFMMLKPSTPIWEAVSPLKYLQFPWRLLAPLSLVLAFLGGGLARLLPRTGKGVWAGHALLVAIALGLLVYNAPLLFPRYRAIPSANPTLGDMTAFEASSQLWGMTSGADYLPVWVQKIPAQSPMAAPYAQGKPVTWLDRQSLPASAQAQEVHAGLNDLRFTFESATPLVATVNQFYFPGWTATIDGAPAPVQPRGESGLISVPVPAGTHTLRLRFGDTPLRRASNWLSLACLLAVAGVMVALGRKGSAAAQSLGKGAPRLKAIGLTIQSPFRGSRTSQARNASQDAPTRARRALSSEPGGFGPGSLLPLGAWAALLAVCAAFALLKVAVLDHTDSIFKVQRLVGTHLKGVQHELQVNFGNDMLLLGYDLPVTQAPAGGSLDIELYWKALRPLQEDTPITIRLVDAQGHAYGQSDSWRAGEFPHSWWEMDEYRQDSHRLAILPGTPPGMYQLQVGVYHLGSLKPLDVYNQDGIPTGATIDLAPVQVTRPLQPPAVEALQMERAFSAPLNDDLELLGANLPQGKVMPGQRVLLTLFWRARRAPQADYRTVALLGDGQSEWPVASDSYPASAWQAGEIVRAQYDLPVPAEAPAGESPLRIALAASSGAPGPAVTIGAVDVLPVEHRMDVPPLQNPVGARLGEDITLLGYELDSRSVAPGQMLHLRLYWQAQHSMGRDLTVFTHLLDASNHISAQQDAEPVQGARPTTSWVQGEVIVDDYQLTVHNDAPAGEHRIEVGMYDPMTGERLAAYNRRGEPVGDSLILGTVQVSY